MSTVLVVDDKELMRDSVGQTLVRAGLQVVMAESLAAALAQVSRRRPDAIVTDLKMPGGTGLELLQQVRAIDDELPVIVMTAFGTVETAVQALKQGAYDYITKPFEGDELIIAVKRAIEHARVVRENQVLRRGGSGLGGATGGEAASGPTGLGRLVGDSPAMRRVKEQVLAVADSAGTVLVCGESGTGKEVVARAVHELSSRAAGPFLGTNCAALSESLLESELFGHERGAFTGAEKLRKGRFELADGGTLLLDEISEVSTRVQAKLLRVLQERVFERVGSSSAIGVDVRVIATSNQDLPRAVSRGGFRQDLFFRLNVLPIHLPPLRDRLEDLPALVAHFSEGLAARNGRRLPQWSAEALEVMRGYTWPGNVRELQNICERAVVLCREEWIKPELIGPWLVDSQAAVGAAGMSGLGGVVGGVGSVPAVMPHVETKLGTPADGMFISVMDRLLEDIERDAIVRTLHRFNGHRQKTAQALGIGVRTLGLKLKKWKSEKLVEETL
jgi:DNA-binding NtrC family response regulator